MESESPPACHVAPHHALCDTLPLMKIDTRWFRRKIKEAGLSQRRLASQMRGHGWAVLHHSSLSRMLSGFREMRMDEARQLAALLKVSPVEVLIRAGAITRREALAWARKAVPKG